MDQNCPTRLASERKKIYNNSKYRIVNFFLENLRPKLYEISQDCCRFRIHKYSYCLLKISILNYFFSRSIFDNYSSLSSGTASLLRSRYQGRHAALLYEREALRDDPNNGCRGDWQ